MDLKITKIRRWRIELYGDVGGDVRFGCGEDEERLLSPLELVYQKLQRTITFATGLGFDSFLQR